jgi:crotonobetainyl-CoA:carnitine CoA-transferase CaiB-like acyl-CoA transferase
MNFQPLKSVRVLDLTSVVVGPAATWRLGQYGAEIIKVENPDGDLMRGLGGQSPTGQHSGTYLHLNRGKRNICLDLKSAGAPQVMQRLIAQADVIVSNMRPKALAKLGLDPASVLKAHPDKIYCLLTGFGTDGPYGGFPAYDSVVQAAAGIPGLSLARDGVPRYVPLLVCDHVVGEIAAGAIMAAIIEKGITGRGRTIEIPMFETMAAFVLQEHLAQQSFDPPVGPPGDRRLLSPHNMPVQTADGHVAVTINTDPQVRAFLKVTGRKELADDPRFATVAARADNVAAWFELRGASLTDRSTAEWLEIFRAADLAAMPCHTLDSLPNDPHLCAVGLITQEEHPTEGRISVIRTSLLVDGDNVPTRSPAAPSGWDTRAVLDELGFSATEIETLISEGSAHEYHR